MINDRNLFILLIQQLIDKLDFLRNFQLNESYIKLHLLSFQYITLQERRQHITSTIEDLKRKKKSLNLADGKSLLNAYESELDLCYKFLVEDQTNLETSISSSTRQLQNIYRIHQVYKKEALVLQSYKVLHLNIINLRRSLSKRNITKYLLRHLIQVTKTITTKYYIIMEGRHSGTSLGSSPPDDGNPDQNSNGIIQDNVENAVDLDNSTHNDIPVCISTQVCFEQSERGDCDIIGNEQCDEKSLSNTEYIQNRLGQPLRKALAYLVIHQPSDPILILANFLLKYRFNILNEMIMRNESEALLQERERIATASEMPECDPCFRYRQVN